MWGSQSTRQSTCKAAEMRIVTCLRDNNNQLSIAPASQLSCWACNAFQASGVHHVIASSFLWIAYRTLQPYHHSQACARGVAHARSRTWPFCIFSLYVHLWQKLILLTKMCTRHAWFIKPAYSITSPLADIVLAKFKKPSYSWVCVSLLCTEWQWICITAKLLRKWHNGL